jgi:hypothetical protein
MSSSSSSSSSTSSKGNKELDTMVLSYLDEKGFGEVAKKIGKKLKIKGGNKLPAGALQAAVTGAKARVQRNRQPHPDTKPRTAYDLFVLDRKAKYNLGNTAERRKLIREEWTKEPESVRLQYAAKRDELKEAYFLKFPDKRPPAKVSKASAAKKKRKSRDPNAPKKPKTSYILFSLAERPRFVQQNPNMKATEVMCALGKRWNEMSKDEKRKYDAAYKVEKAKYDAAMKAYKPDPTFANAAKRAKMYGDNGEKREKIRRDPNAPKRPTSNYLIFSKQERPKVVRANPKMKATLVISEIAKRWSRLSPSEKTQWDNEVAEDKIRFEKEMRNYNPPPQSVLVAQENSKRKPKKDPNRPKRAPTAYLLFTTEARPAYVKKHPNESNPEIMKGLAHLWSKATAAQKAKYEPTVTRLSAEYQVAMKSYVVPLQYQYPNSKDSKKRRKDPSAPKKPATAYLLYSNAKRAELKSSNPNMGPKEIMTELGTAWKLLNSNTKKPFEEQARALKQQYDLDVEAHRNKKPRYDSSTSATAQYYPAHGNRKTALEFYYDAGRKKMTRQNPSMSESDINDIMKRKYMQMPENRKQKYQDLERDQVVDGKSAYQSSSSKSSSSKSSSSSSSSHTSNSSYHSSSGQQSV